MANSAPALDRPCAVIPPDSQLRVGAPRCSSSHPLTRVFSFSLVLSHSLSRARSRLRDAYKNAGYQGLGGGLFVEGSANVAIEHCHIYSNRAGWPGGGGAYIHNSTNVRFEGGSVHSNAASVYGGGIRIVGGSVELRGVAIFANNASFDAGGVAVLDGDVVFDGCRIHGNIVNDDGGGVYVGCSSEFTRGVVRSCQPRVTLIGCELSRNQARDGAAIFHTHGPGQLALMSSRVVDNEVTSGEGGCVHWASSGMASFADTLIANNSRGILGKAGTVFLRNRTLLANNDKASNPFNFYSAGSISYYTYPVPAGHWLPNFECTVVRKPCEQEDAGRELHACMASTYWCSITPDPSFNETARINGTHRCDPYWKSLPKALGVTTNPCTDPQPCQPRSFIQSCDWMASPHLLTHPPTNIMTLPSNTKISATRFPYPCAAGILGSANEEHQLSALCKSLCPKGKYCPNDATTEPVLCPKGSYCPEGSSAPKPCPEGRYSNDKGLYEEGQCQRCTPGHYCSIGSNKTTQCLPGSFAPREGMGSCNPCAAGQYQSDRGTTSCIACTKGHFCPEVRGPSDSNPRRPLHAPFARPLLACILHRYRGLHPASEGAYHVRESRSGRVRRRSPSAPRGATLAAAASPTPPNALRARRGSTAPRGLQLRCRVARAHTRARHGRLLVGRVRAAPSSRTQTRRTARTARRGTSAPRAPLRNSPAKGAPSPTRHGWSGRGTVRTALLGPSAPRAHGCPPSAPRALSRSI